MKCTSPCWMATYVLSTCCFHHGYAVSSSSSETSVLSSKRASSSIKHALLRKISTSTLASKANHLGKTPPLRLEDIPVDGVDVPFAIYEVSRRLRKGAGEMVDPVRHDFEYRKKMANESDAIYQIRQAASLSRYNNLAQAKKDIYDVHAGGGDDSNKAHAAWQDYLRNRASKNRQKNLLLRVRSRMTKARILHPDAAKHVKIEQRGDELFRIVPIQRNLNYRAKKKRTDQYIQRLRKPTVEDGLDSVQATTKSALTESSSPDSQSIASVRPSTILDEHKDPVLGFKVARKSRSLRVPSSP
jgi:hypothetical protein